MAYESAGGGQRQMFNPEADISEGRVSDAPSQHKRRKDIGTVDGNDGVGPQIRTLAGGASDWSQEQLTNAAIIAEVGRGIGASPRDIQIALMVALVESGLRSLNYGDRDSIGMFQQRDAWGSRAARLDPHQSARMFFLGGNAGQRGLLDFEDRNSMGLGEAAQAVQVSAFPDRYAEHEGEAASLLQQAADIEAPPAQTGTLADVPGLAGATDTSNPMADVTAVQTEVNGAGEVTADASGIGELSFDEASSALGEVTFDGAAAGAVTSDPSMGGETGGTGGSGGVAGPAPSLPSGPVHTSDGHTVTVAPTMAPPTGDVFRGSYKGHDPYELTEFDGETVDYLTYAALEAASKEWGGSFRMMQGSHSHDVAASGGTHGGGGVVDIAPQDGDWEGAVTALRKMGFAAWVRNVPGYGYAGSGAHIHAVLMDHEKLAPQAQVQVQSYLNNDDGLVGSRADDSTREFVGNRFEWGDALAMDRERVTTKTAGFLGTPFKWGGEDYTGIDDMGLARKVYGNMAPSARTLADVVSLAKPATLEDAEAGDLLTWENGGRLAIGIGDGLAITTGGPGRAVQVIDLAELATPMWAVPLAEVPTEDHRTTSPYRPPPVQYTHPDETPRGFGAEPVSIPSVSPQVDNDSSPGKPKQGSKQPVDFGV